jgi:galactose-1-phosphate uridylyltransferase
MEIVTKSKETCVFCPERIQEKVPRFDAALKLDGGRVHVNETLLFPNLNPFGEGHAVAVFSHAHFLTPAQFTAPMLCDAFKASRTYFAAAHSASPASVYPTLVWNYMPPSAGSIIHPHVQLLLEEQPSPALEHLLADASQYARVHGRSYWAELLSTERAADERYLGQVGCVEVLASFAPRGTNELLLVMPTLSSLFQLTDAHMADLARCLSLILPAYEKELAVGAFNLVSYSAPGPSVAPTLSAAFPLHFKLFSRPAPKGLYTSDTGPMERMYDSWVIDAVPERLKEAIAPALAAAAEAPKV